MSDVRGVGAVPDAPTPQPLTDEFRGPLVNGIHLFDFPTLARVRVTECRRHGHLLGRDIGYCLNCGAPWFVKRVEHSARSKSTGSGVGE